MSRDQNFCLVIVNRERLISIFNVGTFENQCLIPQSIKIITGFQEEINLTRSSAEVGDQA